MDKAFIQVIEKELQWKVTETERVTGGDINETYLLHSNKEKLFLKLNKAERGNMFEAEKKGLELLRQTGSINVPKPVLNGKYNKTIYLVMEYVEKGSASPASWQSFGQQLAKLHRNSSDKFGLEHDNYIGSLPQQNKQCDSWSEFYATQRILLLTRQAYDEKKCDSSDARMAEKLCSKLDALFSDEKPALLHGDLWSGNYMIDKNGSPVIFDPAVYYGHREMDIGMTMLFGGFDNSFYTFYHETWPMEKNWRQRVDLTQLYPLLVHLILFGGHYYHSVRDILKKYH